MQETLVAVLELALDARHEEMAVHEVAELVGPLEVGERAENEFAGSKMRLRAGVRDHVLGEKEPRLVRFVQIVRIAEGLDAVGDEALRFAGVVEHRVGQTERPLDVADLMHLAALAGHLEGSDAHGDRLFGFALLEEYLGLPSQNLRHDIPLGGNFLAPRKGCRVVLKRSVEIAAGRHEIAEILVGERDLPPESPSLGENARLEQMLLGGGELARSRLGEAELERASHVQKLVPRKLRHLPRAREGARGAREVARLEVGDAEVQRHAHAVLHEPHLLAENERAVEKMDGPLETARILVENPEAVQHVRLADEIVDAPVGCEGVEEILLRLFPLPEPVMANREEHLYAADLAVLIRGAKQPVGRERLVERLVDGAVLSENDAAQARERALAERVVFVAVGLGALEKGRRFVKQPLLDVARAYLPVDPQQIGRLRGGVNLLQRFLVILERHGEVLRGKMHIPELFLGAYRVVFRPGLLLRILELVLAVGVSRHRSLPGTDGRRNHHSRFETLRMLYSNGLVSPPIDIPEDPQRGLRIGDELVAGVPAVAEIIGVTAKDIARSASRRPGAAHVIEKRSAEGECVHAEHGDDGLDSIPERGTHCQSGRGGEDGENQDRREENQEPSHATISFLPGAFRLPHAHSPSTRL